jgi:hypothetical protein
LEARREERAPKPAPLTYEQVEAAAAILAQREPYGMSIVIVNPTKARLGPYVAHRRRVGGPWYVLLRTRSLFSESIEVLFWRLIEVIDRDPIIRKGVLTHDTVLPTHHAGRQSAADCDDPELESYEWNLRRSRFRDHLSCG